MTQNERYDDITVDGIFGYVMGKPDNCLHLLRSIFPKRKIKWVKPIEQKTANNGKKEKNTRFDVWIRDDQDRIYDLEMQRTFDNAFGLRVRYYQSELDRVALKSGEDYRKLKPTAIIFFFPFDPFGGEQLVYHAKMMIEEEHDRLFVSNMEILIFNSQGTKGHVSKDLKAFLDYLNGYITKDNKFIAKLDREIKEYTASPEWRQRKMNWAVKIADAKYEAKREDMKKTVKFVKSLGVSKEQILTRLLQDYGDDFTKKEIEQIIKDA